MDKTELRKRILELPEPKPAPRFTWEFRRKSLRDFILNGDPTEFMKWPVVVESLHTGWTSTVQGMADELTPRMKKAIAVPPFGGGERVGQQEATGTSVRQAWYLQQWEEFAGMRVTDFISSYPPIIHEFGGGYGAMGLVLYNLGFMGLHCIKDLPEVALLQEYYHSNIVLDGRFSISCDRVDDYPIKLYVALTSISEVNPTDRDIPQAENYLICYQAGWEDWDNVKWFGGWAAERPEYKWLDHTNPHNTNHRVLLGVLK